MWPLNSFLPLAKDFKRKLNKSKRLHLALKYIKILTRYRCCLIEDLCQFKESPNMMLNKLRNEC